MIMVELRSRYLNTNLIKLNLINLKKIVGLFIHFKKNEMKLEKLEREPIIRSFIKTLQIGYRRLKKI